MTSPKTQDYAVGTIVEVVRNPIHVARGLQRPQWVRTQVEAVPVGHSNIRANGERQVFVRIDGILVNRAVRQTRDWRDEFGNDGPPDSDLEAIAEEVMQAAFAKAHELLEKRDGFKRYGDVHPSEYAEILNFCRLIVESVRSNGPVEAKA